MRTRLHEERLFPPAGIVSSADGDTVFGGAGPAAPKESGT